MTATTTRHSAPAREPRREATGPALTDVMDLVRLDAILTDEERAVQDTVQRFVTDRVYPHIADWYDEGVSVRDLAEELGNLGVLGMHLTGYGCAGLGAVAYGLACLELEAGDSALRSLVSVQGSLAMYAIWAFGSEDQKTEWLPEMAAGRRIGCFGLSEPDAGSDPSSLRTHARRDGDDWVLNGTKMWITNGSAADVAVIWAQTDDGIRGFLVPAMTPGFTAHAIGKKLSLRASTTAEIALDDVRLPASGQLAHAHGLRGPLSCLDQARFGITFGALGAARDSLQATRRYVLDRTQFGRPLASFKLVQAALADYSVELAKGFLFAVHLGRLKEADQLNPVQINAGKLNSAREALRIARGCRALLGAAGITTDYSPMRHALNLESVLTYEGTSEMHQLAVGHALTGFAAFR